ncbi:UDP-2,4-diacetamido-2,4,6-trideoxy-beta-L-altropyranose hydrolase [Halovenus salina]|uniref:UDP-2,4-diacetamido-2,4, 6-trideoxy-beta-L-altropyranose hydrolase n=1 Tax=Halovenus salina TaxID=1510225 RepID=A0ABD5W559_9EURY|nr:UDP-2,4-diacetamido-2,4,6-trideoxy-beta-L-altropyranose hydrolase [Halovenus salina]
MKLVIRADGGPEIGYGHLVRSGALAGALLSQGHDVTYATTTPEHVNEVCPNGVETASLPSRDNPEPFVEWLEKTQPDAVFTDSYPVDTEYQRATRDRTTLAVLQDDDRHAVCADIFTNGNIHATDMDYEYHGSPPEVYLGPEYVLLREEITTQMAEQPPWRDVPQYVLVTMGGSDIEKRTPHVIRALDNQDVHVDAIVGPGFSEAQEQTVRDVADDVTTTVSVVRDPEDLPERMYRADFAITTASSTIYELLGLGTPIICLPVAPNQEQITDALRERDLATVLDPDADTVTFKTAIAEYMTSPERRRERRSRGRTLVDGRGAARVADVISAN